MVLDFHVCLLESDPVVDSVDVVLRAEPVSQPAHTGILDHHLIHSLFPVIIYILKMFAQQLPHEGFLI